MRRLRKIRGFTLIEVTVTIAFVGILVFGVVSLSRLAQKSTTANLTSFQAEAFRRRVVAVLQNEASWKNTVADLNNVSLACLRAPAASPAADCRGKFGEFVLRDATNAVIYDPTLPNTGISPKGEICDTFSMDGDRKCPFRFNISWTPICPPLPASCKNPQVSIDASMLYKPEKGSENTVDALNENNFKLHMVRGQEEADFGSGTEGMVAKWISTKELGDSFLKEKDGKIGLGLGEDKPRSKLDVRGSMAVGSYAGTVPAPMNGLIVSGKLAVGKRVSSAKLDVAGHAKIGADATPCNDEKYVGSVRFFHNEFQGCFPYGSEDEPFKWCPISGCPCEDPYWDKVVLLLKCDEAAGTSSFKDSSRVHHIQTPEQHPVISPGGGKFGNGCQFHGAYPNPNCDNHCPGDHEKIGVPPLDIGTLDFTIEFWVKPNNVFGPDRDDITGGNWSGGGGGHHGNRLRFKHGNFEVDAEAQHTGCDAKIVGGFQNGVWYHIAVTRKNGVLRSYRNGILEGQDNTCTYDYEGGFSRIGSKGDDSDWFNGMIDEFRVTRGVARYTGSSFPIPTKGYPVCQ